MAELATHSVACLCAAVHTALCVHCIKLLHTCLCVCLQLFMLFLMHAYGGRLQPSKQQQVQQEQGQQSVAESTLYMDAPWRRHWPCLVPWVILETPLSVAWLHSVLGQSLDLFALLAVT